MLNHSKCQQPEKNVVAAELVTQEQQIAMIKLYGRSVILMDRSNYYFILKGNAESSYECIWCFLFVPRSLLKAAKKNNVVHWNTAILSTSKSHFN